MPEWVRLPLLRFPFETDGLVWALGCGSAIAGGCALWAVGAAEDYGDIDVYAFSHEQAFTLSLGFGSLYGVPSLRPNSFEWATPQKPVQMVKFSPAQPNLQAVLEQTDLSVCATGLQIGAKGQIEAVTLYPDDLAQRRCRVLKRHDWTDYRVERYRRKGFAIIEETP